MGQKSFDANVFLAKVGVGRTIIECRPDQVLFQQGDPADAVFFIQSGKVKLTVVSERGKEAVVAVLRAESFFGEGCLNGQLRRLATATALTESAVLRIGRKEMLRVLRTEPAFATRFMSYLLERNSRVEEDLVDQLFNSSEKRLARILLLMANFGKDQKPEPIIPKLSQEMLAEMVGTTRSRVSLFYDAHTRGERGQDPMSSPRILYSACPKCASALIDRLQSPNPETTKDWFRCKSCDHVWGEPRERQVAAST